MAKGKKTGGRKKGTSNKVTGEIREALSEVIQGEVENIPQYIAAIKDPKDKIDALAKILPYVSPKLRESEITVNEQPIPPHLEYLLNASEAEIQKKVNDATGMEAGTQKI